MVNQYSSELKLEIVKLVADYYYIVTKTAKVADVSLAAVLDLFVRKSIG